MQEIRKVQVTSKDTRVISLPKKWLDQAQVRGGDMLRLTLQVDGTLLLHPYQTERSRPVAAVTAQSGEPVELLVERCVGAYIGGADTIHVSNLEGQSSAARMQLRDLARNLAGIHVAEESTDAMSFTVLVDSGSATPHQALRRLLALGRSTETAGERRRGEARRIHSLLLRQANRILHDSQYADRVGAVSAEVPGMVRVAEALVLFCATKPTATVASATFQEGTGLVEAAFSAYAGRDLARAWALWRQISPQVGSSLEGGGQDPVACAVARAILTVALQEAAEKQP
jgi:hypothetical protein